jgi:hypothetical protein
VEFPYFTLSLSAAAVEFPYFTLSLSAAAVEFPYFTFSLPYREGKNFHPIQAQM